MNNNSDPISRDQQFTVLTLSMRGKPHDIEEFFDDVYMGMSWNEVWIVNRYSPKCEVYNICLNLKTNIESAAIEALGTKICKKWDVTKIELRGSVKNYYDVKRKNKPTLFI